MNPDTLRTYAAIFEKPKREVRHGPLLPPTELCLAAARSMRCAAEVIEKELAIAKYYGFMGVASA